MGGLKKVSLGAYSRIESLNKYASYNASQSFYIPKEVATGDYIVRLITDANNSVKDTLRTNNSIMSSESVHITQPNPSDLVVTNVKAIKADSDSTNYKIFAGQSFDFTYTVKNQGTGTTDAVYWNDGFYLSRDTNWDTTDLLIGSAQREMILDFFGHPINAFLMPDSAFTDTVSVTLTTQAYGRYYLLVKADMQNKVYEYMTETNNFNHQYVEVNYTNIVDLAVLLIIVLVVGFGGYKVFGNKIATSITGKEIGEKEIVFAIRTFFRSSLLSVIFMIDNLDKKPNKKTIITKYSLILGLMTKPKKDISLFFICICF